MQNESIRCGCPKRHLNRDVRAPFELVELNRGRHLLQLKSPCAKRTGIPTVRVGTPARLVCAGGFREMVSVFDVESQVSVEVLSDGKTKPFFSFFEKSREQVPVLMWHRFQVLAAVKMYEFGVNWTRSRSWTPQFRGFGS